MDFFAMCLRYLKTLVFKSEMIANINRLKEKW